MKKAIKLFAMCLVMALVTTMTSCVHRVSVPAGQEAALVSTPYMIGDGGVLDEVQGTGAEWYWASTDPVYFTLTPVKHDEKLDDIITDENTPLDFNMVIITQVIKGKSNILLKNYGEAWYDNNLKEYYLNLTRHYVSQYSPFDLTSNREVIAEIDRQVLAGMRSYVDSLSKKAEFPVIISQVITGRAIPNAEQKKEMDRTAQLIQAKVSQQRELEVQIEREKAERQRAIADKAYMREMNLTASQFIQLRAWDIIKEKQGANIDVLFNAEDETKMWNVKR